MPGRGGSGGPIGLWTTSLLGLFCFIFPFEVLALAALYLLSVLFFGLSCHKAGFGDFVSYFSI